MLRFVPRHEFSFAFAGKSDPLRSNHCIVRLHFCCWLLPKFELRHVKFAFPALRKVRVEPRLLVHHTCHVSIPPPEHYLVMSINRYLNASKYPELVPKSTDRVTVLDALIMRLHTAATQLPWPCIKCCRLSPPYSKNLKPGFPFPSELDSGTHVPSSLPIGPNRPGATHQPSTNPQHRAHTPGRPPYFLLVELAHWWTPWHRCHPPSHDASTPPNMYSCPMPLSHPPQMSPPKVPLPSCPPPRCRLGHRSSATPFLLYITRCVPDSGLGCECNWRHVQSSAVFFVSRNWLDVIDWLNLRTCAEALTFDWLVIARASANEILLLLRVMELSFSAALKNDQPQADKKF